MILKKKWKREKEHHRYLENICQNSILQVHFSSFYKWTSPVFSLSDIWKFESEHVNNQLSFFLYSTLDHSPEVFTITLYNVLDEIFDLGDGLKLKSQVFTLKLIALPVVVAVFIVVIVVLIVVVYIVVCG